MSNEHPRIRELMDRQSHAVSADDELRSVAELLVGQGLTGVPVVDGQSQVVGMISEADCLRLLSHGDTEGLPPPSTVAAVMSSPSELLSPDMDIYYVAGLFNAHPELRRFPVVEEGKLVGVVTRKDILRGVLELLP